MKPSEMTVVNGWVEMPNWRADYFVQDGRKTLLRVYDCVTNEVIYTRSIDFPETIPCEVVEDKDSAKRVETRA